MTIASGSRLGPYEIISPLGAGRMVQGYWAEGGPRRWPVRWMLTRLWALVELPVHESPSGIRSRGCRWCRSDLVAGKSLELLPAPAVRSVRKGVKMPLLGANCRVPAPFA